MPNEKMVLNIDPDIIAGQGIVAKGDDESDLEVPEVKLKLKRDGGTGKIREIEGKQVVRDETIEVYYTHSSPGCVYLRIGGKWYRRCTT